MYDDYLYQHSMNVDLDNPSNFRIIEIPTGRCYSLRWNTTFDTLSVQFYFFGQTSVSIDPPGNFFNSFESTIIDLNKTLTRVKVLYETFKVLSFDGEICQNDEAYSHDNCLYSAIQEVTL